MAESTRMRGIALRSLLWLALGSWIGAWAVFGLAVVPAAFGELPSTEIAGRLVASILTTLNLYGAGAGLLLAGLAQLLGRPVSRSLIPLIMSAVCLYSQFGVSAEMAEIRELAFGPQGNPKASVRFQSLHTQSVRLFSGVGVAALVLLVLHVRDDERD